MKRMMQFLTMVAIVALIVIASPSRVSAQGAFYTEEPKDGRIYVFYYMDSYAQWKNGGEMGKSVTRIGYGPNGETVVFDSNEAVNMYNFKHNLPIEIFAAAPAPPAPQEKLPYKFSGLMFGDYYYNSQRDPNILLLPNVAAPAGPQDFNAFIFRRIYFTFDDQLNPTFSTRFRLEADSTALTSNGKITVFVKDAWLKWANVLNGQDLTFGIQPTPGYNDISETQWAFRSLEKTIMDLRGIIPSRDLGVAMRGRLDSGAKFNYWFEFGNGAGTSNPENDKFKRVYFQFQWKPNDRFMATIYQDYRALPDISDPNNASGLISNSSGTTAWFVNYGMPDKLGIGYEGFLTKQQNGNKSGPSAPFTLSSKNTIGDSFWAWYYFNPKVGVVGRYDYFDPNTGASGDKRYLFIGSVVLKPYKSVYIMPNYYWEGYEDVGGKPIKSSITPRITFYWVFP